MEDSIFCRGVNERVPKEKVIIVAGRPVYGHVYCDTGEPVRDDELKTMLVVADLKAAQLSNLLMMWPLGTVDNALKSLQPDQKKTIQKVGKGLSQREQAILNSLLEVEEGTNGG